MRPNEAQFFPERYAQLPELGRLTGRGNTANVEVVLNAKTDLIVDVGSTGASLASLAHAGAGADEDPVRAVRRPHRGDAGDAARARQADGQRARGRTPRRLVRERAEAGAAAAGRAASHPLVYYGRGAAGLQTGGKGSINVEMLDFLGARNAAAERARRLGDDRVRAGPAVESRGDPHHRPELLGLGVDRSALARGEGGDGEARLPLAAPAVRLVRLPARREPPARHLVGRQAALPAGVRPRPARQGRRVPPPVLSPRADSERSSTRCSASPACCRDELPLAELRRWRRAPWSA